MSAVSPVVLLLLLVAVAVGGLMIALATGRLGEGIDLPRRRPRRRTATRGPRT